MHWPQVRSDCNQDGHQLVRMIAGLFVHFSLKNVRLLRNYDFEAVSKMPLPDYTTMVVAPRHTNGECKVNYKRKQ